LRRATSWSALLATLVTLVTDRRLTVASFALAILGVAIAAYLTYVHYRGLHPLCLAGGGGCERVQTSSYAKLAGVPVALIGLIGYVVILASLLVAGETARLATVGLTVVGLGFSAYLTYREVATIKAICQWCVASAVVMTLLAILAVARFLRADVEVPRGRS
jgi:uncharacterized membrane protein